MTYLLEARGLTRRFGGVVALDNLDLAVVPNEIIGLIGPNGSGKTTFFNVVTGIYGAHGGSVTFEGSDITRASARAVYHAGVSRTFQRSRLSLPLSIFDNIMIGNHKARYIRFESEPAAKDARYVELPASLRVREAVTSDAYRSIVGQWGLGERAGPLEAAAPGSEGIADDPDDDTPEAPRPLAIDSESSGRVHLGDDVDWLAVSIPPDQRSLRAVIAGDPYVGVEVLLHAADGTEVPMSFEPGERPGTVVYAASVEPGADYVLEVRQPPSSVVVTFDTSVSVGPYLDSILGALRGFGADVVPGREAVRILPFDGEPILPGWNDQPFEIEAAAATYVLNVSSSGAEHNLARAARDLAPRRGARAVLIITDAASSSYRDTADLWQELASVRPLVFAVQTGGLNEAPSWRRHQLMTRLGGERGRRLSLCPLEGGYRDRIRSPGDLASAARWLPADGDDERRRAAASRAWTPLGHRPDDGTGRAGVVLAGNAAVGVILDTSGTMLESSRGERRIDVAKRVLVDLLGQGLPPGTRVAMRAFGSRCSSDLLVPLGPLDPSTAIASILDRRGATEDTDSDGGDHREDRRGPRWGGRSPCRCRAHGRCPRQLRRGPGGRDPVAAGGGRRRPPERRRVRARSARPGGIRTAGRDWAVAPISTRATATTSPRRSGRQSAPPSGSSTKAERSSPRARSAASRCRCRPARTSWRSRSSPRSGSTRSTWLRVARSS